MQCFFFFDMGVFSDILVASKKKVKNRVLVDDVAFWEIGGRLRRASRGVRE